MKYVGFSDNQIRLISNNPFESQNLSVIKLDEDISDADIFCNYKIKDNKLVIKKQIGNTSNQKIAFVTNWKMPCGLSTYAEALFPKLEKQFKDHKYFIEENIQT